MAEKHLMRLCEIQRKKEEKRIKRIGNPAERSRQLKNLDTWYQESLKSFNTYYGDTSYV